MYENVLGMKISIYYRARYMSPMNSVLLQTLIFLDEKALINQSHNKKSKAGTTLVNILVAGTICSIVLEYKLYV